MLMDVLSSFRVSNTPHSIVPCFPPLFFVRIARLIRVYDTPPSLSLILYFYSFLDRVTLGSVYH